MRRPNILDRLRERGLVGRVLQDILGLDAEPKPGASVRCPNRDAHRNGDRNPSFVVGRDGAGGVCMAGCGLRGGLLDLVCPLKRLPDRAAAARYVEEHYLGGSDAPREPEGPAPRVVRTTRYEIRDAEGNVVAVHVRRDLDDGSKSFAWELPDGTLGLGGLPSSSLPLYGAELLKDAPDGPVLLAEGEKAADKLRPLGFLALATVTGARGTPSRDVLATLAGRAVYVWPDNDELGRAHMARIAALLADVGADVRAVEWKDAPPKGDAADLVESGGTRADVERLLTAAKPVARHDRGAAEAAPVPVLVRMADVEPEPVLFEWDPYVPRGKITIVEGDPGDGKTTFHLALTAAITRGWPMPGADGKPGGPRTPANVLILANEDGLADTLRPRLDAAGADPARVFVLTGKETTDAATGRKATWPVTLADLPTIEEAVKRHAPAAVVVDPVQGYLGAHVDMHRANEVRPVLAGLAALAERYGFALILIRHLSKAAQGRSLYRGLGSIDFAAIARSVLLIGRDPADPARRVAVHVKSSTAQVGPTIAFTIVEHVSGDIRCGKVEWCGTSDLTAADVLAPDSAPDGGALGEAEAFLRAELPCEVKEVLSRARAEGLAEKTVRRAAKRLRVVKEKSGFRSGWTWRLAEDGQHAPREPARNHEDGQGVQGRNLAIFGGDAPHNWMDGEAP